MNDLRTMLHDRAARADRPAPERVAAVRRRVRVARRRRTTAVLGASAAAVAAIVTASVALVPGVLPQRPSPSGPLTQSVVSAGVAYRVEDRRASTSGELRWEIAPAEVPRLLGWSAPDGRVSVTGLGEGDVVAPAGLGDLYALAPGERYSVRWSGEGAIEAGIYRPRILGAEIALFRPSLPTGQDVAASALGEPGQGRVAVDVPEGARAATGVAVACWGRGAEGLTLLVTGGGSATSSSVTCDRGRPQAPDANGGGFTTAQTLAGERVTAAVVDEQDRPVSAPADLRIGLAVYSAPGGAGSELYEDGGVLWRLEETRTVEGARASVDLDTRRPLLAWVQNDSSRDLSLRSEGTEGDLRFGGGGAVSVRLWRDDPRTTLSTVFDGGEGEATVFVYRRADGPWSD